MNETVLERIERAKSLLANVRNAAMATVNLDGSPHNTPYMFMRDSSLEYLYWGSHPESEHSKNVTRTGQVFVVLYEADQGGGLYVRADDAHICTDGELIAALQVHNERRIALGKDPLPLGYYQGDMPQRMYMATIRQFWVNSAERMENGQILRDIRYEVKREDLLDD